ncbi:MAG: hypothetical protein GY777_32030 [Candidatus Brocadiaceae bacterium]|nr:hypothetical protein [Candidatus Brocadiaceae bacterium]
MNKRDKTGYNQVLAEVSKTKEALAKLDDFFFCKADKDISNDPDDPREKIGHLPGLDRLIILIPLIITRLEIDVSKNMEAVDVSPITEGLKEIQEAINGVLIYYLQDDVDNAIISLNISISNIDNICNKKLQSHIRFLHDITRVTPDFQLFLNTIDGIQRNKKTRLDELETDESWSVENWLYYYREQARLEEPLIAMVDSEGLTGTSLEKGMKQMIKKSENMDKIMEKQFSSFDLMRKRDAAFDQEYPEEFLNLSEIPDIKDEEGDDDYEFRTIDLQYEEEEGGGEEQAEPWASSLPELRNWNESTAEQPYDSLGLSRPDLEDDPVYSLLKPFAHDIFELMKHDHLNQIKEGSREADQLCSPLEHYLVILTMKAQVKISSCYIHVESTGHDAPRKGVYLFAMECLERIAEAIETFSQEHLYHLAAEARNIKKQIELILF